VKDDDGNEEIRNSENNRMSTGRCCVALGQYGPQHQRRVHGQTVASASDPIRTIRAERNTTIRTTGLTQSTESCVIVSSIAGRPSSFIVCQSERQSTMGEPLTYHTSLLDISLHNIITSHTTVQQEVQSANNSTIKHPK
jgi:hypothetical protein